MFCKYCGHEISDNAKFCDECGKKVNESVSAPTTEQKASPVPVEKNACPLCGGYFSQKEGKCRRCGATLDQAEHMLPDDSGDATVKFLKVVAAIVAFLIFTTIFLAFGAKSETEDSNSVDIVTESKEANIKIRNAPMISSAEETKESVGVTETTEVTEYTEPVETVGTAEEAMPAETQEQNIENYVLNTSSQKFHYPWCSSVKKMKSYNKSEFTGTRVDIIARGYSPCGNCHP